NPHISLRQIDREAGISRRSILRILHRQKVHLYHVSLYQQLQRNNFVTRVEFCRWTKHQIQNNELLLNTVLFTDEATFKNHGNVSLHNMYAWCGITGNKIIGPHFVNGDLNGNIYANFIKNYLYLHGKEGSWFTERLSERLSCRSAGGWKENKTVTTSHEIRGSRWIPARPRAEAGQPPRHHLSKNRPWVQRTSQPVSTLTTSSHVDIYVASSYASRHLTKTTTAL
ncbi:hypothetical protein WN55_05773, partial [Dufourea novaeangliae]